MTEIIDIQTAIYNALVPTGLSVFDRVPEDHPSFPFVTIGEDVLGEWDTKTVNGFDGSITIHVWSRYSGRKETKQMQQTIYDTLHNQPPVGLIMLQHSSSETFLDPDGITYHGVSTYRVLT